MLIGVASCRDNAVLAGVVGCALRASGMAGCNSRAILTGCAVLVALSPWPAVPSVRCCAGLLMVRVAFLEAVPWLDTLSLLRGR